MPRGNKNAFIKEGKYTCKCGREFNKSQSYYAHLSHCKIYLGEDKVKKRKGYHTIYGEYVCKCGKAFSSSSSYIGHTSHCIVHLGEKRYLENLEKYRQSVKIACEHAKTSHTEEVNKRQSETRKRKYASGEISLAFGIGRGKYSFLRYKNQEYAFRSTYEFIYALYLLYNGIKFEYETIRVTFEGKTYFCDFKVNNEIIEIKGQTNADISKQKQAFESKGYKYRILYSEDIKLCYEYLKTVEDIDSILRKIREGNDNKDYFIYEFK